ncbi:glycosyltransferase family 9 protein [Photobacterium swingsii]|uniref:glycosyltransferase family 9 protein n=1 Tax=Photobacterium swingsii TaxID=680026 RepID=UPI002A6D2C80|nr:Heptosyltransferase [Vibrio crassostreae]
MSFKDSLRKFDQYRRKKMMKLEVLLFQVINNKKIMVDSLIKPEDVEKILIVRTNKRIGNMFFLLPFLHETRKCYPNAEIDLVLNLPWQGKIFENIAINKIFYSHFSFKDIFKWGECIKELKKQDYDLVLMPYQSVGDAVTSALMNGRNKASFVSDINGIAFPHAVTEDGCERHFAFKPLKILEGIGNQLEKPYGYEIILSDGEVESATTALRDLSKDSGARVLAYFRGARGTKVLSDNVWRGIVAKFKDYDPENTICVEILSPDIQTPLEGDTQVYQNADMRALAAFLAQCDMFICSDTGPLHLADAAGANCVGLFTETDPTVYGCIGANTVNLTDIEHIDVSAIYSRLGLK